MPISRSRKEEFVSQYNELLGESNGIATVHTRGLSVPQVQELRRKILDAGGRYVTAKNTLIRIALEENEWIAPEDLLLGPTSIVFGRDDFPGVAKALLEHIKDADLDEKVEITGGIMVTEILDSAGVEAISKLPSLDELRSQIAGMVVAPAVGIVSVIQAANSGVVNVIQAYLDKNDADDGEDAA